MKRRLTKSFILLSITSILFFSSACGKKEEAPFIKVNDSEDVVSYTLVPVTIDDVILTQKVECTYAQTKEQEVSFDMTGKYVDKVFVRQGDVVKKGDLLCELSSEALENEIARLEYSIARNELLLSYLDTNEALDIQDSAINKYKFGATQSEKDEDVVALKERYEDSRIRYNDTLEFDRKALANKKSELSRSRLYASMDGIVYKLKDHLEGSTTKAGTVIMTIVDNTDCLFTVNKPEYKDLFTEGVTVPMTVMYTSAAGDYELMPKDIESWEDSLLFSVFTGPDSAAIEVGTRGTITAPVKTKERVLSLPKNVIHMAEDKAYVYVVNENGNRDIKWIEIGLVGDTNIEITGGLAEGEKVIKK